VEWLKVKALSLSLSATKKKRQKERKKERKKERNDVFQCANLFKK
jgi:hypothetical protein